MNNNRLIQDIWIS